MSSRLLGIHVLLIATAGIVAGCAREPGASCRARTGAGQSDRFRYIDELGSTSRVEHTKGPSGVEAIHGVTEIVSSQGRTTHIEERARLDSSGRLSWAEISGAGVGTSALDRVIFDAAAGLVRIDRAGQTLEWEVPTGEPWAYPAPLDQEGRPVVTPVTAWITLRATLASPDVRVLYPDAQRTEVVPRDQLAVPTELGTTVIIGDDGADMDTSGFVERVRVASLGTTLAVTTAPLEVLGLPCR